MQGLHVSFVCLFNHDSKYHSRNYILPKLCAHAAHVSAFCLGLTSSEPSILNIRNTRDRVDWSNAWWTCRMLLRIGLYSKSDEYILGSGSLNSISQVIGHLTLFYSTSLRNYISCSCVTNPTLSPTYAILASEYNATYDNSFHILVDTLTLLLLPLLTLTLTNFKTISRCRASQSSELIDILSLGSQCSTGYFPKSIVSMF